MHTRIYAVADIHGKQNRLNAILNNIERWRPDILVLAGDITGYIRAGKTVEALSSIAIPMLYVRGNTDRRHVERLMAEIPTSQHLHLKSTEISGLNFVGVSGTLPLPFHSKIQLNEAEPFDQLDRMLTGASILVCHPPPMGICDRVAGRVHAGSRAIYNLAITHNPALVICGHIHEARGPDFLGKVRVVNCAMAGGCEGVLIDIQNDLNMLLTWLPAQTSG
jgi:Icc-related predicted phosphoesterase